MTNTKVVAADEAPKKKRTPPAAGKGRVKGSKNKATKELKEMILAALDESGGISYLVERANDPKTQGAFLALIGKVLPMTIQGPGENGEHIFGKVIVEVVKPEHE